VRGNHSAIVKLLHDAGADRGVVLEEKHSLDGSRVNKNALEIAESDNKESKEHNRPFKEL
jgi:hypothetical protein